MDESFNFLLFWCVLGVKNGMPIPFPGTFWLLICGSTWQNKSFFTSKSEKHLETRLHSIRAYLMRKTCIFTRSLRKKGFRIQSFWISHFIPNLIPRVSCLHDRLMTMMVFLVVNTIGKARYLGTLNYQLTGNS